MKRLMVRSRPSPFETVEGGAGGGELLAGARRIRAGFLLQFQDQRQTSLRRRLKQLDGCGPIDGAVVGRQMLVLFAVVVVEMHGGNEFAQRRKTFFEALLFGQFGKVCVANIKIKAQAVEARFLV